MYNSRLNVSLSDKESTIVDISITDEDKQRAEDILCKLIDVYNEQWLKDRNRVAESTFEFITNRLNTLSKELGDVDQKISDYKSQNKMPDIDAASNMYMAQNSKNNDQILQLNNQLGWHVTYANILTTTASTTNTCPLTQALAVLALKR